MGYLETCHDMTRGCSQMPLLCLVSSVMSRGPHMIRRCGIWRHGNCTWWTRIAHVSYDLQLFYIVVRRVVASLRTVGLPSRRSSSSASASPARRAQSLATKSPPPNSFWSRLATLARSLTPTPLISASTRSSSSPSAGGYPVSRLSTTTSSGVVCPAPRRASVTFTSSTT